MAYRDDKDALLARAGALDRENKRLESELDSAEDERDDLRDKLAGNERELARLRKKLARHERTPDQMARRKKMLVFGAAAGMVVVGGVVAMVSSGAEKKKEEVSKPTVTDKAAIASRQTAKTHLETPGPRAPEAPDYDPALAELNAVYTVRWCLDTVDFTMRNILLMDGVIENRLPWEFDSRGEEAGRACARNVKLVEEDGALEAIEPKLAAYREALSVLLPVVKELARYYEEEDFADDGYAGARTLVATLHREGATFRAASDALREGFLPIYHRVRAADGETLRSNPAAYVAHQAAGNAVDLMDALFATELSFELVEQRMNAIAELRDANEGVDTDRAVMFYKFAKRVFRSLRDQGGSPSLGPGDIHELRLMVSYFRMADFAQPGPSTRESLTR